uniref:AlNc14C27G2629 protein n=1 Tax=Albugo laibachii Nc14 TaxID=890382 RepID=F0W6Z6_9STRA|nr:AlNc14C27G2629 [Albugo laibachii Nc14]|eukprot:CCA16891.1 AlNc14C27G2629 [Albugo laibachii Nc14]
MFVIRLADQQPNSKEKCVFLIKYYDVVFRKSILHQKKQALSRLCSRNNENNKCKKNWLFTTAIESFKRTRYGGNECRHRTRQNRGNHLKPNGSRKNGIESIKPI